MQNILSRFWDYDWLRDYIFCIINFILVFVFGCMIGICSETGFFSSFYKSPALEFFWTIFPVVILFFIGIPRIMILYQNSVDFLRDITIKVTGHQWYWRYDYSDFSNVEFDSFIVPTRELSFGDFRLLEVDNRVVVPGNQFLRFVVTSGDVLHSWALPRIGLKVDACPGRLNFIFFKPTHFGIFFGQCREICGSNHSFIPICLERTSPTLFSSWLSNFSYAI